MVEAVMRAQGYAVSMEHDMSRVFGCDRGEWQEKLIATLLGETHWRPF